MKVLLAHNFYQVSGGEDAVVQNEEQMLRKKGVEVHTHFVHNQSIRGFKAKIKTVVNVNHSQSAFEEFSKKLATVQPDVVHVHNFFPLLTPAIHRAAWEQGIPVVQTLHNFRILCANALLLRQEKPCEKCLGGSPYWGTIHGCYRDSSLASLPLSHSIASHLHQGTWQHPRLTLVALSEFSKSRFVRGGIPAERIRVKPNFLSEAQLPQNWRELRRQQLERLKSTRPSPEGVTAGTSSSAATKPQAPLRCVYVGRLSSEKGASFLAKAWQQINPAVAQLEVFGGGPLEAELRALQLPGVQFYGAQPKEKILSALLNADLLILPSLCYENFPMVIAEAYALGLPVLGAQIGSIVELIRPGVTGDFFTAGDSASLLQKVTDLAHAAGGVLERWSHQARQEYENHYTEEKNWEILSSLYAQARS